MAGKGTVLAPQEFFNSIAELAEEPHDIALVAVNAITDESEMRVFLEEYAAFLEGGGDSILGPEIGYVPGMTYRYAAYLCIAEASGYLSKDPSAQGMLKREDKTSPKDILEPWKRAHETLL